MPDSSVHTIKDQIFFQYAKIIAVSAYNCKDSSEAKKRYYWFIKSTFKKLQTDEMKWSAILREDKQMLDEEKKCVYCWSTENLSRDHIIPKSLHINDRCTNCEKIQGISNHIRACKTCNSKKGDSGLYHFRQKLHPNNPKFYDTLPPLLEKKYLKTIYSCHQCKGDLEKKIDGISVLDVDV